MALEKILNHFILTYANTPRKIIERDISKAYQDLQTILTQKQHIETFVQEAEANFRAIATDLRIPIEGSIELTFKCNINCIHCYCVHCEWENIEINTAQWIRHIDDMVSNGCVWLLITGGEPLMRKDFQDIFIYAKNKGMLITLFTNALLINERICKLFDNYPPHWLEISIYGLSDETYQRVTGSSRGFTQLVKALNLLDKYNVEYSLKTTLVNENSSELKEMIEFAKERGAVFRYDARILPRLDDTNVPKDTSISADEVVAVEFYEDPDKTVKAWESTKKERSNYYAEDLFFCNAGKVMFNIDPFGEMSACGRIKDPSISLETHSFKSAWSTLTDFTQQPPPKEFRCKSCSNIGYCKPCPITSTLSPEEIEEQFCQFTRIRAGIVRSHR